MPHELRQGDYLISDDRARLDLSTIHALLRETYWARHVPREIVARSLENSLCFGAYSADGQQVAVARVVTDYATFGWICDVIVHRANRGHGLGKALMRGVVTHPRLQSLRRLLLATEDAHGLYTQFGFKPLTVPDAHLELRLISGYSNPESS